MSIAPRVLAANQAKVGNIAVTAKVVSSLQRYYLCIWDNDAKALTRRGFPTYEKVKAYLKQHSIDGKHHVYDIVLRARIV
jgi:hypothetical protein